MKILYVDDDAMNRRVVRDMLSVVGLTMAEAEDAEVGLRMINQEAFNIILMDLRMPGMDGLTAIEYLRARRDGKGRVPVIVVTADTTADIKDRCRTAGADDVLQKPVALQSLVDALGRAIANSSSSGVVLS